MGLSSLKVRRESWFAICIHLRQEGFCLVYPVRRGCPCHSHPEPLGLCLLFVSQRGVWFSLASAGGGGMLSRRLVRTGSSYQMVGAADPVSEINAV